MEGRIGDDDIKALVDHRRRHVAAEDLEVCEAAPLRRPCRAPHRLDVRIDHADTPIHRQRSGHDAEGADTAAQVEYRVAALHLHHLREKLGRFIGMIPGEDARPGVEGVRRTSQRDGELIEGLAVEKGAAEFCCVAPRFRPLGGHNDAVTTVHRRHYGVSEESLQRLGRALGSLVVRARHVAVATHMQNSERVGQQLEEGELLVRNSDSHNIGPEVGW